MPQVPRANPQVRSTGLPALPNARANVQFSSEDIVGNVPQATARLGQEIYQEETRKADEVAVMSARRQLQQYQNQLLYDPKEGALTKKGKDSFSVPETVMPKLDEQIDSIASGLNDRQKMAFMRSAFETRSHTDVVVQRHVYTERERYDQEETMSFVETERDASTQNYNDPKRIGLSIDNQKDAITQFARRNGKSADWVKKAHEDVDNKTHLMVIQRAIASGDDSYAEAYYKEVKGVMTGKENTDATKLVEDASYRGKSTAKADEITQVSAEGYPPTRMEAQKEVQKITDPKLRDLVQSRVDQYYARLDAFERKNEEQSFDSLMAMIDAGVGYSRLPPQYMNQLSGQQRAAVRSYAKARDKGDDIVTDWGTYYKLVQLAVDDKATFADPRKTDLLTYRHKLHDTEFKQLVGLQAAANAKDDKFEEKISGYRTTSQVVDGALRGVGIDPTPKDTEKDKGAQVEKFRRAVDQRVLDFKTTNKRAPNTKETQEIVDELLLKGPVPGSGVWGWFQTKKRVFELNKGETIAVTIDQVPRAHKQSITNVYKRVHNRAPTDAEIVQEYQRGLLLDTETR